MNSTSCLLVLLALSGCVFAKSTFRNGLDIVRKEISLDCVTECSIEVNQIDLSQYNFTTPEGNRDYEEAFLAVICRDDCFSDYIQYKVCLGLDEDVVTAEVQRECATNNEGQFCTLLYYDGVISGDIPELPFCDTCTSGCQSDLNSISSYLGCCAAPYADADFVKPLIEKCGIALDDPCPTDSTVPDSTDPDSDCATSDSQECANEEAQIDITQFDLTTPEGNRDYHEASLAVFCRADCFSANIQQHVCLGFDEDEVTAALQLHCAKNNGEFCLLLYNDGVISGDIPQVTSCSIIGENCTSDCQSELTSISSFFGCCTAIYAEAAFMIPNKETFETCEVTLDDPCRKDSTDPDSTDQDSDQDSNDQDSTDEDSGASYATPMFISMIIIAFIATIM